MEEVKAIHAGMLNRTQGNFLLPVTELVFCRVSVKPTVTVPLRYVAVSVALLRVTLSSAFYSQFHSTWALYGFQLVFRCLNWMAMTP
jgi:hypothetical protein